MGRCAIVVLSIVTTVISLTLFITLMSLSFRVLSYDEFGIKYHKVSRHLDREEIYEEGRHYVQPGEIFLRFKKKYVEIQFQGDGPTVTEKNGDKDVVNNYGGISGLTSDGLSVRLDLTLQYQIQREHLFDILDRFGLDFEGVVATIIRSAVRDACSNFTAESFYTNRGGIQIAMLDRTRSRLEEAFVTAAFLQLLNVQLPGRFEQAIKNKEEARADVEVALNERKEALIQSQTTVLEAQEEAIITKVRADAESDAIITAAINEAEAIEIELNTSAIVYAELMSTLNLTPEGLINYISIEQIQSADSVVVAMEAPAKFSYNVTGQDNNNNNNGGSTTGSGTTGGGMVSTTGDGFGTTA